MSGLGGGTRQRRALGDISNRSNTRGPGLGPVKAGFSGTGGGSGASNGGGSRGLQSRTRKAAPKGLGLGGLGLSSRGFGLGGGGLGPARSAPPTSKSRGPAPQVYCDADNTAKKATSPADEDLEIEFMFSDPHLKTDDEEVAELEKALDAHIDDILSGITDTTTDSHGQLRLLGSPVGDFDVDDIL